MRLKQVLLSRRDLDPGIPERLRWAYARDEEGASGWHHSTVLTITPHLWKSLVYLLGLAQGRVGVEAKQRLGVQ